MILPQWPAHFDVGQKGLRLLPKRCFLHMGSSDDMSGTCASKYHKATQAPLFALQYPLNHKRMDQEHSAPVPMSIEAEGPSQIGLRTPRSYLGPCAHLEHQSPTKRNKETCCR